MQIYWYQIEVPMQVRNLMDHQDLDPMQERFSEENVKRELPEKERSNQE